MIEITPELVIDENEISEQFVRASGPGGQNVNKLATAVQLRFDVANSPSLPGPVRERLSRLAGQRLTAEGILLITAKEFRTQAQNRQAALKRLLHLLQKAAEAPKVRRKTKPSPLDKERRLKEKRRRAELKRLRGNLD
jgi:ribosome-associated protein